MSAVLSNVNSSAENAIPFKIVSLADGADKPSLGISPILPAFQPIRLNAPINQWKLKNTGDHTYRLSIGGYPYLGVADDKLVATIYSEQDIEWKATWHEEHDGHSLSPANDSSKCWTVDIDSGIIELKPLEEISSVHLFWFEPQE